MALALLGGAVIGVALRALLGRSEKQITDLYELQLEEVRRSVADRDARLLTVESELLKRRAELDATRRSLAAAQSELASSRLRNNELEPLPGMLYERESQLAILGADLELMRSSHASEVGNLRRKLGDADALRTRLARSEQQLRSLDQKLALVQRGKDDAIASLSTRLAELETLARRPPQRDVPAAAAPRTPATPTEAPYAHIRELEQDLARLRRRVVQLEPLFGTVQQRDDEIARLNKQILER